jgi:hypothetical protein
MSPHGEPLRLKPGGPFLVSLPIAATLLSAALGAPSRLPPHTEHITLASCAKVGLRQPSGEFAGTNGKSGR